MKPQRLGHRLLSGLQINVASQILVLAVNLWSTPILVRHFGADGYALYTLMWTLMNYLTLVNMGTTTGALTYSARHGFGPGSPMGMIARRTMLFQILAASLGGFVLYLCRGWVTQQLCAGNPRALEMAPRIFACVAVAAPFYLVVNLGGSILYGKQEFARAALIMTLQSAAVAVMAASMVHYNVGGLKEVAAGSIVVYALLAAGTVAAAWSAFSSASRRPRGDEASGFIRFCLQSHLTLFVMMIISQSDRLFVANQMSLSQTGYYVISASIAQKLNSLCATVVAVAFPIFAELHGSGQEERLRRFYLKISEIIFFVNLPLTILAFVLAPQFMTLWLGVEFSNQGTWPFRLILWSNMLYLLSIAPNHLAMSRGHPHLYAAFQAVKALIVLCSWPALIARWGILGAAGGLLLGEALITPLFVGYIHNRFIGITWGTFWIEACARPVVASLGLAALSLAVHANLFTWTGMIAFSFTGLLIFFVVGYRLLDREAQTLLLDWLNSRLRYERAASK